MEFKKVLVSVALVGLAKAQNNATSTSSAAAAIAQGNMASVGVAGAVLAGALAFLV
ncbi:hypothetical protein KAFR_0D01665 [Kazachstania africana CBS 2517]|uniref:Uncharacterized protein n=1 Tax=Kazachstania africana (strain ATCC 22294 / BCRC 22015 / CBS 2517 / CECT 1963 / NBRC 1671 / NRRL Y-8276) TaxID=1071382 RepID=H2ATW3_KAZAF|nr:hypothetical protein KAFR_0D01665 [Kazachstania africana CBS 2517]CCF57813.1 hypothetical protein KAFR_0D01665 [Kazachstania africana CBS 2517]